MMLGRNVLLGFGAWVILTPQIALTQTPAQRGPQAETYMERTERARTKNSVPGLRPMSRTRLGTYRTNRFAGIPNRLDRLHAISPWSSPTGGMLADPVLPPSPVQRILDQRNLLRVRSPLARTGTAFLGRATSISLPTDATAEVAPTAAPDSATTQPAVQPMTAQRFEEAMAGRLERAAADNFELGATYFREGDFLQARYRFDMVKDIWIDNPRPYIASMIASYELEDLNRSLNDLFRAFRLAKSLDDLRIEGFVDKFCVGDTPEERRRALEQTVNRVNRFTQSVPLSRAILAYYSWVNGDLGLAESSAEVSAKVAEEPIAVDIRKFRDMLIEEERAGQNTATTQPAAR